jgi:RNA polymerase sigma factor (TIGR02999 family)
MDRDPVHQVTRILADLERGDDRDTDTLLSIIYDELRALAGSHFKDDTPGHTLQPTALVHEVYLKLTRAANADWKSRAHFFAVAARAMRQILANHAERKRTEKRGGGRPRVTLLGLATPPGGVDQIDLIALDEALGKLAKLAPRQAQVVEMRFLAGIEMEEIAQVLGTSLSTVNREWRMARAFLECELHGDELR